MRPLKYSINVTLDGCVDHREGNPDAETHQHSTDLIAGVDAIFLGRTTYQLMEFWRDREQVALLPEWMHSFADAIGEVKKYVVSSTLSDLDWNSELITGDVRSAVEEIKRRPGGAIAVGGVQLALAFAEWDLIDEYEFIVHPRVVGHGPTLLAGLTTGIDLKPLGRTEFQSGAVANRYEVVR